ncbi:hypothetical protein OG592_01675 [Streptomyces avidinii]|uniref:hypothetical protein n=1 Tax=Streptomyces avidinii TaxID=1895 RepID=UPI00386E347F|nr:hypothetical protein OG592_01675 [Streptomyces avidinii]
MGRRAAKPARTTPLGGARRRLLVTGAALIGTLALATGPARATTANVGGQVGGSSTYYGTARTVTAEGSHIYLKADSGGIAMKAFWYKCSDRSTRGADREVGSGTRQRLGSGFRAGTVYCLGAAADVVSPNKISWSGTLNWNVFS